MKHVLLGAWLLAASSAAAQSSSQPDTIPFQMNGQHNLYVRAILNQRDTLNLNFDTGTTELILTTSTLHRLPTAPTLYSTRYSLQLGHTTYQTKVYDAVLTAQETDGRFGWDFFQHKVVEVDYDRNLLIVHAALPPRLATDNRYTKLPLEVYKDLLLVPGSLEQGGIVNTEQFLFDTGYQRTAMLDDDLLQQRGFPTAKMPLLRKVVMHGAQGNEIPVFTRRLAVLRLGKFKLRNVPVQQTTANKPLRNKNIHILGNEVLQRFNVFLDLEANAVYLRPNHLYRTAYTEGKKARGRGTVAGG